ncbi:hypothetical protein BGW80DRAFT_196590 [Lactifluus volemus]|nr:hypothetical protein BGW80DRAFT_196590 [Lactifluus volemus]
MFRQRNSDDAENGAPIHLDGVTVLEFESLLTFFYEGWQEGFSMSNANWEALLAIAHRYRFSDAEFRARREVFLGQPPLDPVSQIVIAEKNSVPISFIVPALEELIRRKEPLRNSELAKMSGGMVAGLGIAREKYVRESSKMFASDEWLKQAASKIVRSVWPTSDAPTSV